MHRRCKSIAVTLLFYFACLANCDAQISHKFTIGKGNGGSGSVAITTGTVTATGATFVEFSIWYEPNSLLTNYPVISDNNSNSWILAKRSVTANDQGVDQYICYNYTGATEPATFSCSCAACDPTIGVDGFSGVQTSPSPVDQSSAASSGGTNESSWQAGSITPTTNGQLVFLSAVTSSASPIATPPAGFTYGYTWTGTGTFGGLNAYQIQSTAIAVNPSYSLSPSNSTAATLVSYKAATINAVKGFFKNRR